MILKIFITVLPLVFLFNFFQTEYKLKKDGIALGGDNPINKIVFLSVKYLLAFTWIIMAVSFWDFNFPGSLASLKMAKYAGIFLWILGFAFLYIARYTMGSSFRMGIAQEETEFVARGIFKYSRNPMYLGLGLTLTGGSLHTMNFIFFLITIYIIIIHHLIILAEEKQLRMKYGESYQDYCGHCRRYF